MWPVILLVGRVLSYLGPHRAKISCGCDVTDALG
jgi:hypothetical protein